jgi:hypothetical protein
VPNRTLRELIEANIEQVFSLVDMAEEQTVLGNPGSSVEILQAAETVFADIERRIFPLSAPEASPFLPLLTESRRAIENARSHIR